MQPTACGPVSVPQQAPQSACKTVSFHAGKPCEAFTLHQPPTRTKLKKEDYRPATAVGIALFTEPAKSAQVQPCKIFKTPLPPPADARIWKQCAAPPPRDVQGKGGKLGSAPKTIASDTLCAKVA